MAEGVNLQLVRRKEIHPFGDLLRKPRGMFAVLAVVFVGAARTERPHWASYDAGRGLLFDRCVRKDSLSRIARNLTAPPARAGTPS